MSSDDLYDYEKDFHAWLETQAEALDSHHWAQLDVEHLVEELKAMAVGQRRELHSRLHILLLHLLKWHLLTQPRNLQGRGWKLTIREQRRQIETLLEQSPSLRFHLPELFMPAWQWACDDIHDLVNGCPELPQICPWDFTTIMTEDFLP
jgi:Domain of unknown function DUF29